MGALGYWSRIREIMYIKIFFSTIIGILSLQIFNTDASDREESWALIQRASTIISNDSQDVKKLLKMARHDKSLVKETSVFNKKTEIVFKKKGISFYDFVPFISEDPEELPYAAFKTIMLGFDFMSGTDWKDISDPENMVWLINTQFKSKKIKQLTQTEIMNIKSKVSAFLTEPYSFKKQVLATNKMIETINNLVTKRNYRVLWYLEVSDSHHFCIVKPEVYQQLNNTQLGFEHEFKVPKFTLDGELE